ncbi:hypothetical protein G6F35_018350 [Rhizopus arrhizus]|nr:hypothetical protein G6F35_018350 [Rhizopus arrhizus]
MRTAILDCVVVEDSVPGVRAARAARMRAVGYVGASHNGPDQRQRLLAEGAQTAAGTGSGLTRTARSTPTTSRAMPAIVSGSGIEPRRMKA